LLLIVHPLFQEMWFECPRLRGRPLNQIMRQKKGATLWPLKKPSFDEDK
jgi:hypothetical protein